MKRVAVEDGLQNVKQALEAEGFNVLNLSDKSSFANAQAVVISGMDENVMLQETRLTDIPVINAKGKDANEVVRDIKQRFQLM